MQQQPALDTPAVEQHPLVERVVETTRGVGSEKSNILFAVITSYALSISAGMLVAYIFDRALGFPRGIASIQAATSDWKIGVVTSIMVAFFLGLMLPVLFARRKRPLAVLWTIILQFITLVGLILVGLGQLPVGAVL